MTVASNRRIGHSGPPHLPIPSKIELRVLTANVAGWNKSSRMHTLSLLTEHADVLLISEARCQDLPTATMWTDEFRRAGWKAYITPSGNPHTGGSAVLIRLNIMQDFSNISVDDAGAAEGRVTRVRGTFRRKPLCLLAIYAPASPKARTTFLTYLATVTEPPGTTIIAGGDFNCTLADRDATGNERHLSTGRKELRAWTEQLGVVDAWLHAAHAAPDDYGWTKFAPSGASRIDHIYISAALADTVSCAKTIPLASTDHHAVQASLGSAPDRGRWRFNTMLLHSAPLCSVLAHALSLHLDDYAAGRTTLGAAWVAFKLQAQQHARGFARALARRRRAALRQAQAAVHAAKTPAARAAAADVLQRQEDYVRKGELARRGVATLCADRPTRQFYQRATVPNNKGDIQSLALGTGGTTSDPGAIREELECFWTQVYGAGAVAGAADPAQAVAETAALSRLSARLTDEQQAALAAPYTEAELKEALASLRPGSSPGNDGLPPAFYTELWDAVAGPLTALLNATLSGSPLPPECLAARIVLLPKSSAAAPAASQFRPISLLNTDYKIWAKAVTLRVLKVIPHLCRPSQTGFVPARSILHNLTFNRDCVEYVKRKGGRVVMLFLDFEKAYDRVSWSFRDKVMQRLGFPGSLLNTLATFYRDAPIQLDINGELGAAFYATRGVRQGCPLSPSLFCLYIEPLNVLLNDMGTGRDGPPTGVALPPTRRPGAAEFQGGSLYADDATVYCNSTAAAERVISQIKAEFCLAAGALLNADKSRALVIGEPTGTTVAGIPLLQPDETVGSLGALYAGDATMRHRVPELVDSMDRNLAWWRTFCVSLHSRAHLANSMLSSKLWYHLQFEPVDEGALQSAKFKVWRCVWGSDIRDGAKKGVVNRDRACATVELGGLGIIAPHVMHRALKARAVNMTLEGKGQWWTAFSEALVEEAAQTGPGTGFDGLAAPEARERIAANCTPFWKQALLAWNELAFVYPPKLPPSTPKEWTGATLLVERALRSCPEEAKSAVRAIAGAGRQYLSDFFDPDTRALARPVRVLTSVRSEQSRNAALHRILAAAKPDEVAKLADPGPPKVLALYRVRSTPQVVQVTQVDPPDTGPCGCAHRQRVEVSVCDGQQVAGPLVPASSGAEMRLLCACQLSPLLVDKERGYAWGEAAITALYPPLLGNGASELTTMAPVSDLRVHFGELMQPVSMLLPVCQATWAAKTAAAPPDAEWEVAWRCVASATLPSYGRTLLWRIMHWRVDTLAQSWREDNDAHGNACLLCGEAPEILDHLFAECSAVQHLWASVGPLAEHVGLVNHASMFSRLTGIPGDYVSSILLSRLPASERSHSRTKEKKLATRLWTELRAQVLCAIWKARCGLLHGKLPSRAAALKAAESQIKRGLTHLAYLYVPDRFPWASELPEPLPPALKLPSLVWKHLAPLVL